MTKLEYNTSEIKNVYQEIINNKIATELVIRQPRTDFIPVEIGIYVSEILKYNKTIKILDIAYSNLNSDYVVDMVKGLKSNSTLKTLKLSDNHIGDIGVKAIAEVLKDNQTLKTIDLGLNNIGPEGAKDIAEALKFNNTLTTLYLDSNNNIGDNGAKFIGESLKYNKLKKLYLNGCNIGPNGAIAISEGLESNNTLEELYLSNNNIQNTGLKAIIKALKSNTSIKKLYLSGVTDNIDDIATLLAELLKVNNTLKDIHLTDNNLGSDASLYLLKALKTNYTLTRLNLGIDNKILPTIYGDFRTLLERNREIQIKIKEENVNLVDWMSKNGKVHWHIQNQFRDFLKVNKPTILEKLPHPLSEEYIKNISYNGNTIDKNEIIYIQTFLGPFILDIQNQNNVQSLRNFFRTFDSKYNSEVFKILDDDEPNKVYRIIKYILDDIYNHFIKLNHFLEFFQDNNNHLIMYNKYRNILPKGFYTQIYKKYLLDKIIKKQKELGYNNTLKDIEDHLALEGKTIESASYIDIHNAITYNKFKDLTIGIIPEFIPL